MQKLCKLFLNLPKVKSLIQTYLILSVLLENRLAFLDAKVEVLEKEMDVNSTENLDSGMNTSPPSNKLFLIRLVNYEVF